MAKGAHRTALEEVINQLRIPKNYSWLYKPMQQFTAENREDARAEGEAFGTAKGKAEGEVSGRVATLLSILRAKGFALSQQKRQQIASCHDIERLDRWILAAVNAGSLDDVFAGD
jgi:predicted transposase YdaD